MHTLWYNAHVQYSYRYLQIFPFKVYASDDLKAIDDSLDIDAWLTAATVSTSAASVLCRQPSIQVLHEPGTVHPCSLCIASYAKDQKNDTEYTHILGYRCIEVADGVNMIPET